VDNLHVFEKDELLFEDFIIRWIPANPEEKIDLKTYTGLVQKFDVDYNLVFENTYVNGIPFEQTASYAYPCTFTVVCGCRGKGSDYCGCDGSYSECVNVLFVSCSGGGGGGGNSGDGVGNSGDGSGLGGEGGGGSTIGTDGDPLHPFVPNVLEYQAEIENNPCLKLAALSNSPNYSETVSSLAVHASGDKEYGWSYSYFPYTSTIKPPSVCTHVPGNIHRVELPYGGNIIGANHNHTSGGFSMYSTSDLVWLLRCAEEHDFGDREVNYDNFFINLTNVNQTYSIKIKDWNKLKTNLRANYYKIIDKLNDEYNFVGTMANPTVYQNILLKVLKKFDLGLGLFQEIETNGVKKWNELILVEQSDSDPNHSIAPQKSPCN